MKTTTSWPEGLGDKEPSACEISVDKCPNRTPFMLESDIMPFRVKKFASTRDTNKTRAGVVANSRGRTANNSIWRQALSRSHVEIAKSSRKYFSFIRAMLADAKLLEGLGMRTSLTNFLVAGMTLKYLYTHSSITFTNTNNCFFKFNASIGSKCWLLTILAANGIPPRCCQHL